MKTRFTALLALTVSICATIRAAEPVPAQYTIEAILELLEKHPWGLPWRYPTMSPADVRRLLSFHAITAFCRSGRPKELALLQEMSEADDLEHEFRDAARGGLHLHEAIQKMGLQAALDPDFRPEKVKADSAYEYDVDVRQYLLERRSEFLSEYLAESGKPVLIWENNEKTENQSHLLKRLSEEPGGIETLRQILLDIEAREDVKQGTPVVTIADDGDAVVAIPLENSQSIVKKHAISGVTVDSTGRLVIYMIRHQGGWFWNPFGW